MKRHRLNKKEVIKKKIELRHSKLSFIGKKQKNEEVVLKKKNDNIKPIVGMINKPMRERDKLRIFGKIEKNLFVNKNDNEIKIGDNSSIIFNINENFLAFGEISLSIIISYKESADDRRRNLQKVLNYFSNYLCNNVEIILVEQDKESKVNWLHSINNFKYIKHVFLKNNGVFNKGWGYNVGALQAKGDYLIFNDSDVLVSLKAYQSSIKLLDDFDVVNPYKYLYWLDEIKTNIFINNDHNFEIELNEKLFSPSVITGGIFLIKKNKFIEIKGFDESSYGHGFQDYIFDEKIKKLELGIGLNEATALHLNHAGTPKPGTNNTVSNDVYFSFKKRNKKIFETYKKMTKSEIINKINNVKMFGDGTIEIINVPPKYKLISVVMTYYNRKQHLINTLNSFTKSKYNNFEVIVVDDASDEEQRIEDLEDRFKFLKVIRIDKENKKHINPCVPFNIGLNYCFGDIIILQNPECFHYDDVFQYVIENIDINKYLAFSVVNKNIVNDLAKINWNNNYRFEINKILSINVNDMKNNHWYVHSAFRPMALNFCTAITRKDMVELNGFDERYADGIDRDDVEFLTRIKRKNMNIIFVDNILVIHQSHNLIYYTQKNWNVLREKNHQLFAKTTAIENIIKANPNKIILE